MNDVIVFDLDGTLTDTSAVDARCFLLALTDTFGIDSQSSDWSRHTDVTDSGILDDLVMNAHGVKPSDTERQRFIERFVALLEKEHATDRRQFREIPGANTFVERLREHGWTVTIATGGWRASAIKKLEFGGFDPTKFPLASANDARKRTDIVKASLQRAGIPAPDRVVVFGDAIWDVKAAHELGLPLIAIAPASRADTLRDAGAFAAVKDYTDPEGMLVLIDQIHNSI